MPMETTSSLLTQKTEFYTELGCNGCLPPQKSAKNAAVTASGTVGPAWSVPTSNGGSQMPLEFHQHINRNFPYSSYYLHLQSYCPKSRRLGRRLIWSVHQSRSQPKRTSSTNNSSQYKRQRDHQLGAPVSTSQIHFPSNQDTVSETTGMSKQVKLWSC